MKPTYYILVFLLAVLALAVGFLSGFLLEPDLGPISAALEELKRIVYQQGTYFCR